jgi:hypothetical protein
VITFSRQPLNALRRERAALLACEKNPTSVFSQTSGAPAWLRAALGWRTDRRLTTDKWAKPPFRWPRRRRATRGIRSTENFNWRPRAHHLWEYAAGRRPRGINYIIENPTTCSQGLPGSDCRNFCDLEAERGPRHSCAYEQRRKNRTLRDFA